MEDGIQESIEPMGMANGTVVTVEHLFQNTPVRLGFQRRPATEHDALSRLLLLMPLPIQVLLFAAPSMVVQH